jgi:glycosyltransferase involved in cell wall biosynthesis
MPQVSVVIPSYNSAGYIVAAVESARAQTFTDIEILVVDDGSTDDTRAVVAPYETVSGTPVRYIHQANAGVSAARNKGIAQSRGRYVAFLDADDLWLPQKLERQMAALAANPAAGACHTANFLVDDNLNPLGEHHCPRVGAVLEDLLFRGNAVGTPSSVVVEKRWLEKTGGFNDAFSHSADWDMWIRLAQHTEFVYVDEPLLKYRWHANNMSRNVPLIESDTLAALRAAFDDPALPVSLRKRRAEAIGRQWMVVAGCYFQAGRRGDFLRCAFQSVRQHPAQLSYLLKYPLRRLNGRNLSPMETQTG